MEDDARKQKSSGIRPFTYTKEEWPTDQPTETVTTRTGKSGGKVSNKMKVLNGTETPEMLIMWEINFESKVQRDTTITTDQKLTIFSRLVVDEAQTAVNTAISLFDKAIILINIDSFLNPETKLSITSICNSDKEKLQYLDSTAHKEARFNHVMDEFVYHLRLKIFGHDDLGKSSYIQL